MEPAPKHRRIQPLRALRSAMRLRKDSARAIEAFELMDALRAVEDAEPLFQRFVGSDSGAALCRSRSSLGAALAGLPRLATLPSDSLGHMYAVFMTGGKLYGDQLRKLSHAAAGWSMGVDADRQWFFDRLRDQHDLWHVVTGYGSDIAGEVRLQAFSFAQTGIRSQLLISVGGIFEAPLRQRVGFARSVRAAYALGKQVADLSLSPWESWLGRNLHDVRAELGLAAHADRRGPSASAWS